MLNNIRAATGGSAQLQPNESRIKKFRFPDKQLMEFLPCGNWWMSFKACVVRQKGQTVERRDAPPFPFAQSSTKYVTLA